MTVSPGSSTDWPNSQRMFIRELRSAAQLTGSLIEMSPFWESCTASDTSLYNDTVWPVYQDLPFVKRDFG